MAYTYAQRKNKETSGRAPAGHGPSIAALAAGAAPTQEQMGSRVDLPEGIREKMESSFGADFSNVKLYESQTVADAGAQAVAQGTNIAFAPGKLNLTSTSGQALLGHELSHVVSQARGESTGSGFLKDASLEAQADRQGAMAARGESVYSGPVSPLSASSAAASAGPMQASKDDRSAAKDNMKKYTDAKARSEAAYNRAKTRYRVRNHAGPVWFQESSPAGKYLKMTMGAMGPRKQDELMGALVNHHQEGDAGGQALDDYILRDFIKSARLGPMSQGMLNNNFRKRAKAFGANALQVERRAAAASYLKEKGLTEQVPEKYRPMLDTAISEDYDRNAAALDMNDMISSNRLRHNTEEYRVNRQSDMDSEYEQASTYYSRAGLSERDREEESPFMSI